MTVVSCDPKNVISQILQSLHNFISILDNDTLEDKPDEVEFNIKYLDENQETFISDIKTYKASLKAYPLHKIIK